VVVVVEVDWIGLLGFENEGSGFDREIPFIFRWRARRLFERERARRRNQFLWFPIFHLRWCTVYVLRSASSLFCFYWINFIYFLMTVRFSGGVNELSVFWAKS
jgi:hypothetical protein